jgi:hypothetical protein
MNKFKWQILLGVLLLAASLALYVLQIALFHAPRDTFFYLFQDLAFIPIQVLLVTLILNQLLNVREKLTMLNKLNMVIGAFFSEVGTGLLKSFSGFDCHFNEIRKDLIVANDWTDDKFATVIKSLCALDFHIDYTKNDLSALGDLLAGKRAFLLGLLENANLLEHETFTELLWAVFHLTEELTMREDFTQMTIADGTHLAGDIKRAYVILIAEWLAYMRHLKNEYPYLFSLAVRTNPFDPKAEVVIK